MRKMRDFLHLGGYTLEPRERNRYYGGGDPPPAQATTVTSTQYSPEEEARRAKIFAAGEEAFKTAKSSYANILNPLAKPVGPSADTLAAQGMAKNFATGAGTTLASNMGSAVNFGTSGAVLDPASNPALANTISMAHRRIGETFTDPGGVLSKIRTNFMGSAPSGQSSREAIAMGLAGRGYANMLGDTTASMMSDAYNKGLDYMGRSMALAPTAYNLGIQPAVTVGGVGSQQESYDAARAAYDAGGQSWMANRDYAALGPYASLVTGMSNPSTSVTATAPQNKGSGAMGVLGGTMMGWQMGTAVGMPWAGAGAGALLSLLA